MLTKYTSITINPWLKIYLKFLAIIFTYSTIVHVTNILGFGEAPWLETPLTWRIGDVVYCVWDLLTAIGLWSLTIWGITSFLLAILSQFVIYTLFIDYFAFNPEQQATIDSLLATEAILIVIFLLLIMSKK